MVSAAISAVSGDEVGKVIVGQLDILDDTLMASIAGGHVSLEGVLGLGRRSSSGPRGLPASQVSADPVHARNLMPAGPDRHERRHGEPQAAGSGSSSSPARSSATSSCADEINRATPKTQSALLEAMQEHSVTDRRDDAPARRAVLRPGDAANPLEMEGPIHSPRPSSTGSSASCS